MGGYIALEFSHIFHGCGADVTILEMNDRILIKHDQEVALELQRSAKEKGIKLHAGAQVRKITGERGNFTPPYRNGSKLPVNLPKISRGSSAINRGDQVTCNVTSRLTSIGSTCFQ